MPKTNPFGNYNWGGTQFTWPSAQYFQSVGITDPKVLALAGTKINSPGGNTTNQLVDAIYLQLGRDNATKFFSKAQIDPQQVIAGSTKASRSAKSFLDLWKSAKSLDNLTPQNYQDLISGYTSGKAKPVTVNTPGGPVVTTTNPNASSQATAYDNLSYQLNQLGLGSLTDNIYNMVFKQNITNPKALWSAVQATPEYKQVFQGLEEHNKNFPQKLTEAQYLSTAQQFVNIAQTYGLPQGVLTNKEIGQLIAGGVSPQKFNIRVQNGYLAAVNADPNTKAALQAAGVTMGDLTHYYLDPTKGEQMILQKTAAAQMQGYAKDVGVKNFTSDMAQQLATQARSQLNPDGTYSIGSAQKALEFAGREQPITGAGVDRPAMVDTNTLLASQIPGFGGIDTQTAQQQVTKAEQATAAPFEKGGGFETTSKGVTGIGASK